MRSHSKIESLNMKLLRHLLRMFCISEELTLCEIIVTAIAVSIVALIYLSFVTSLLVFHHWSVTTMECLLLVYVGLEIKTYWFLRKNPTKLLRINHRNEQIYHFHHIHESMLNLLSLYFSASFRSMQSRILHTLLKKQLKMNYDVNYITRVRRTLYPTTYRGKYH